MTRKEKETMKLSVESDLWCFIDRKVILTQDLKNEILHLIHTFGKQNDGEETLKLRNPDKTTIHFLNADNEHLQVTPTMVYHNIYDEIGVYGEDGNYNQDDFEDIQCYEELLALMYNSIFFKK